MTGVRALAPLDFDGFSSEDASRLRLRRRLRAQHRQTSARAMTRTPAPAPTSGISMFPSSLVTDSICFPAGIAMLVDAGADVIGGSVLVVVEVFCSFARKLGVMQSFLGPDMRLNDKVKAESNAQSTADFNQQDSEVRS